MKWTIKTKDEDRQKKVTATNEKPAMSDGAEVHYKPKPQIPLLLGLVHPTTCMHPIATSRQVANIFFLLK